MLEYILKLNPETIAKVVKDNRKPSIKFVDDFFVGDIRFADFGTRRPYSKKFSDDPSKGTISHEMKTKCIGILND